MSDILAGVGWGLAGGLAVALVVALAALIALWKRTQAPPPDEAHASQNPRETPKPTKAWNAA